MTLPLSLTSMVKGIAQPSPKFAGVQSKDPSPDVTLKIIRTAATYGLMLGRVGLYGNVIRIAPPLIITEEECDHGIDILDKAMSLV